MTLWKKYGLTHDDFLDMGEAQDWTCPICKKRTRDLVVDHCHKMGYVRSLMCTNCNTGIGMLGEDPDRIAAAAEYLRSVTLTEFRAGGRPMPDRQPSKPKPQRLCLDCGRPCSLRAFRCKECFVLRQYAMRKTKLDWPPLEELMALLEVASYVEVGRRLGVSDNAVRKHIAAELKLQSRVV